MERSSVFGPPELETSSTVRKLFSTANLSQTGATFDQIEIQDAIMEDDVIEAGARIGPDPPYSTSYKAVPSFLCMILALG